MPSRTKTNSFLKIGAAKDETRPVLQYAYKPDNNSPIATANGYVLHLDYNPDTNYEIDTLYPMTTDNPGEGHFPDFMCIVPRECDLRIHVQPEILLWAVKSAGIFGRDNANSICLHVAYDGIKQVGTIDVIGKSPERGDISTIVQIEHADNNPRSYDFNFSLNYHYLVNALKHMKHMQYVPLAFVKDNERPLIVGTSDDRQVIIMPMSGYKDNSTYEELIGIPDDNAYLTGMTLKSFKSMKKAHKGQSAYRRNLKSSGFTRKLTKRAKNEDDRQINDKQVVKSTRTIDKTADDEHKGGQASNLPTYKQHAGYADKYLQNDSYVVPVESYDLSGSRTFYHANHSTIPQVTLGENIGAVKDTPAQSDDTSDDTIPAYTMRHKYYLTDDDYQETIEHIRHYYIDLDMRTIARQTINYMNQYHNLNNNRASCYSAYDVIKQAIDIETSAQDNAPVAAYYDKDTDTMKAIYLDDDNPQPAPVSSAAETITDNDPVMTITIEPQTIPHADDLTWDDINALKMGDDDTDNHIFLRKLPDPMPATIEETVHYIHCMWFAMFNTPTNQFKMWRNNAIKHNPDCIVSLREHCKSVLHPDYNPKLDADYWHMMKTLAAHLLSLLPEETDTLPAPSAETDEDNTQPATISGNGMTAEFKSVYDNKPAIWWISGDTKPHKNTFKAHSFRWSKKQTAWYYIHGDTLPQSIIALFGDNPTNTPPTNDTPPNNSGDKSKSSSKKPKFPKLKSTRDGYLSDTDAAKLIHYDLQCEFPDTKFSVRCGRGSSSITVSWTEGPLQDDVMSIIGKYKSGSLSYDGEYMEHNPINAHGFTAGGPTFLSCSRNYTADTLRDFAEWLYNNHAFYTFGMVESIDPDNVTYTINEPETINPYVNFETDNGDNVYINQSTTAGQWVRHLIGEFGTVAHMKRFRNWERIKWDVLYHPLQQFADTDTKIDVYVSAKRDGIHIDYINCNESDLRAIVEPLTSEPVIYTDKTPQPTPPEDTDDDGDDLPAQPDKLDEATDYSDALPGESYAQRANRRADSGKVISIMDLINHEPIDPDDDPTPPQTPPEDTTTDDATTAITSAPAEVDPAKLAQLALTPTTGHTSYLGNPWGDRSKHGTTEVIIYDYDHDTGMIIFNYAQDPEIIPVAAILSIEKLRRHKSGEPLTLDNIQYFEVDHGIQHKKGIDEETQRVRDRFILTEPFPATYDKAVEELDKTAREVEKELGFRVALPKFETYTEVMRWFASVDLTKIENHFKMEVIAGYYRMTALATIALTFEDPAANAPIIDDAHEHEGIEQLFGENESFYPTHHAIVRRMMRPYINEVNIQGFTFQTLGKKVVLEPSAGKGDILDVLTRGYNVKKSNALAIEINPELQQILEGKGYQVIDTDFLEYNDHYPIDLIVMNPPFNAGVHHLLKAWSILPAGGSVVCLLNSETINNPYTVDRQKLAELIELFGETEDIGQAFAVPGTQRKTYVNVHIIWLHKPAQENTEPLEFNVDGMDFDTVTTDEFLENPLAHQDILETLVQQYNRACECVVQRNKAENELKFHLQSVGDRFKEDEVNESLVEELNAIKTKFWRYVFYETRIADKLTSYTRDKFWKFQKFAENLAFTINNIMQIMQTVMATRGSQITETIQHLFSTATSHHKKNRYGYEWGWKTNNPYKIAKKIIVPGIVKTTYSGWQIKDDKDFINDLDKTLAFINGDRFETIASIKDTLEARFEERRNAKLLEDVGNYWDEIESEYFYIRFYMKGTVHLTWKDDLLRDEFNRIGAGGKMQMGDAYN